MAAAASAGRQRPFLTVSFSGAGLLLPYHLGVASTIERSRRRGGSSSGGSTCFTRRHPTALSSQSSSLPPVKAVAGSSSGAIAAAVLVRLPHRIEEYADRFLAEGGRAFHILEDMLHDEERRSAALSTAGQHHPNTKSNKVEVVSPGQNPHRNTVLRISGNEKKNVVNKNTTRNQEAPPTSLHVATTRSADGTLAMHDFRRINPEFRSISASWSTDDLLKAVQASCRIPASFHPADVIQSPWSSFWGGGGTAAASSTYPDGDGVCIDGSWYVDGGISAPAPPTPLDETDGAIRLVVCPISGSSFDDNNGCSTSSSDDDCRSSSLAVKRTRTYRISPSDDTRRLLPFELRLRGGLTVYPSVQNLRSLGVSAGVAGRDELLQWYERGSEDAEALISSGIRL